MTTPACVRGMLGGVIHATEVYTLASATLTLRRGRIYPSATSRPLEALAVRGDRVILAGGEAEIAALEGPETQIVDLGGRTVLPGLTDAHLHLQSYARYLEQVDCETNTLRECLQRVRTAAERVGAGAWVLGHGWNQNVWGKYGTAAELDTIAAGHPVFLTAKSMHCAWVNSLALEAAGVDASTVDPPGGRIDRDAEGRPSGILFETAVQLVSDRIPQPAPAHETDSLATALEVLVRLGLTCVHDFDGADCLQTLERLREQARLPLRIVKHIQRDDLEDALARRLKTGSGDEWIRFGHVKLFADGALGPRTAWMLRPYEDEAANTGIPQISREELIAIGQRLLPSGLGLAVHAIGDAANREVLDALEALQAHAGASSRLLHRIEHVQIIDPSDRPRLARLGVTASMQPIHATSDMIMADRYWGTRVRSAYAWRSLAASGATLAFGSDAPVESPNPFFGLHAAVTRRRPDGTPGRDGWTPGERLDLAQALDAYTRGPALAVRAESLQGHLAPGSLADFVVLDNDLWAVDPDEWLGIRPVATAIGGVFHHREF